MVKQRTGVSESQSFTESYFHVTWRSLMISKFRLWLLPGLHRGYPLGRRGPAEVSSYTRPHSPTYYELLGWCSKTASLRQD